MGWKPELALQLAAVSMTVRIEIATAVFPSHTSTSPCLENRRIAVNRSGVETIWLENRDNFG
jgi:hypothetical protein